MSELERVRTDKMPGSPARALVVGGGISGLACAYRLKQLGVDVTLLEAQQSAGGLIGSVRKDGFLFDHGPQSFQGTDLLLDLIHELGIEDELQIANPKAPRYVLRGGRLQHIPMSPQGVLTSSLLTVRSRWKVVSEPFRRTRPPTEDESVADFVRRKFGHEILEYLVSPFVSGIYAGDPEKLSLRAAFPSLEEWERQFGSVLRGAMKSRPLKEKQSGPPPLCSFRGGLGTLMQALARSLGSRVRLGSRVHSIRPTRATGTDGYEIEVNENGQTETFRTRAIVLATPAYTAAQILQPVSTPLAHALSGIAYAPVAVVATGYFSKQFSRPLDGFGFLVPRREKFRTLGTVWNSSLFPGRAPEGSGTITSFLGGAMDADAVAKPETEIAEIAHDENARIMGISGPPQVTAVWKYGKALPQYNLGHGHIIERIRDCLEANPGLFLAGNYLQGPAIGKCVERGFRTAESAHVHVTA